LTSLTDTPLLNTMSMKHPYYDVLSWWLDWKHEY